MNTETGQIAYQDEIDRMDEAQKRLFVPVTRDLTIQERNAMQIKMYESLEAAFAKLAVAVRDEAMAEHEFVEANTTHGGRGVNPYLK